MIWIIVLAQAVLFGGLSAIIASDKGRSVGAWIVIGAVAGVFGFIAAIAVSDQSEDESKQTTSETTVNPSSSQDVEGGGAVIGIVLGVLVVALIVISLLAG